MQPLNKSILFFNNHNYVAFIQKLEFDPYVCQKPGCGKSFPRPYESEAHMSYHNEEEGHVCKVSGCDVRFKHLESLSRHEEIHTRDKLYVCDVCQKRITGSDNWKLHKIFHSIGVTFVEDGKNAINLQK
jgi:uncharacterized Zn-finger protein